MQKDSNAYSSISSVECRNRRKHNLSGVAVVASAAALVPLAGVPLASNSAIANVHPVSNPSSPPQATVRALSRADSNDATDQAQVIVPQVDQEQQAAFSHTPLAFPNQRLATLVNRREDINRALAYTAKPSTAPTTSAAQTVTAATAQIATAQIATAQMATAQTAAASVDAKECQESSCRQLGHIDSQLAVSNQKIQRLEKHLSDFSAQHGQGNISDYQTVLGDRILEISSQKQQLATEIDRTRSQASKLRTQLSLAAIEVDIAARILANDSDYQAVWSQLEAVEATIRKEYSQVTVNTTASNQRYADYQLYADYRPLLEKTQNVAQAALNRYLLVNGSQIASAHYQASTAIELLNALILNTNQQNIHQRRQVSLSAIEIELMNHHQRLAETISEYEYLQSELNAEQRLVDNYHLERDRILTESSALASAGSSAYGQSVSPTQPLVNARALVPLLTDDSIAKALLGVVIAASLLATATHRSSEKKAAMLSERILEIKPVNGGNAASTVRPEAMFSMKAEPSNIQSLDTASASTRDSKRSRLKGPFETLSHRELTSVGSHSLYAVNDLEESAISRRIAHSLDEMFAQAEADRTAADIAVADLEQALQELTADRLSENEVSSREIAPIRLPVAEIDAFVEKAISWVLKDLGLELLTANASTRELKALAS